MPIVCRGCKRSRRIDRRHVTCHKHGSDKPGNQQYHLSPPNTLRSLRRSLPCYRGQSDSYLIMCLDCSYSIYMSILFYLFPLHLFDLPLERHSDYNLSYFISVPISLFHLETSGLVCLLSSWSLQRRFLYC